MCCSCALDSFPYKVTYAHSLEYIRSNQGKRSQISIPQWLRLLAQDWIRNVLNDCFFLPAHLDVVHSILKSIVFLLMCAFRPASSILFFIYNLVHMHICVPLYTRYVNEYFEWLSILISSKYFLSFYCLHETMDGTNKYRKFGQNSRLDRPQNSNDT